MAIGYYVVAILLLATFSVMVAGVVLMGVGGKVNVRYSNQLMVARVTLQGLSLLAVAFVMMSHG